MARNPELLRRSVRAAAPLALVLAVALGIAPATGCERGMLAPPTLEPLLVHVDGTWFRDAKRRVVLLRGVNLRALVRERDAEHPHAPREGDFAWLASLGFNLIRLPVPWASIEPRPNAFDFAYLNDKVDPLLRLASNHGMQVILAPHQVRWSSCFGGGHGAPGWTCASDAAHGTTVDRPAWGSSDAVADVRAARAQCAFFRGALAPDGRTLREHYKDAWRVLARYYEQDKRIVAFDLLNEPSAASCLPTPSFTTDVLNPFYEELRVAVRSAGAPQALLYQPAVGRDDALVGAPPAAGPDAIFGPHLYSQTFGAPAAAVANGDALAVDYERAEKLAEALGGPLLIGEIGANGPADDTYRPVTREFLAASLAELDRRLIGGAVWAFVPQGAAIPASGGIGIGNEEDALVLARPFARRIAGIPVDMRYDAATRNFSFTFRDDDARAPADPSEIFLPARSYPHGFAVELTPGDRWTFDEHTRRLLVYRGDADRHTVRVTATTQPAAGAR